MGRAPCCDKANVKKGPWSPEEDAKLKAYIEQYGTGGNWIALPQKIGLKRCGKSCRLRWLNYLRPNIKHGGFSEEEDNIICSLYISIGSRWSIIAAQLPGRTDNDIKNYWNTRLKKKLLGRRKQSNNTNHSRGDANGTEVENDSCAPLLSNSALERLQLHMQLQTLQNPLSFYNNPTLWPKLHPVQEKMIQSLQFLNDNTNPLMQNHPPSTPQLGQDYWAMMNNLKIDEMENSLNDVVSPSDSSIGINNQLDSSVVPRSSDMEKSNVGLIQEPDSGFQAVLDDLLNNETIGFQPQEDPIAEFDCFKEMESSKDSAIWWSNNEFDSKSASLSSWDYVLGYNQQ